MASNIQYHSLTIIVAAKIPRQQLLLPTISSMNQSAHHQQHQHNGALKLPARQSLEYEELKFFDWGIAEIPTDEQRVFVDESSVGVPNFAQQAVYRQQQEQQQQEQQNRSVASSNHKQCHDNSDQWNPIPFRSQDQNDTAIFGFSRHNYMDGIRAWSTGNFGNSSSTSTPSAVAASPSLRAKADESPPGMIRSTSGSLSSASETDEVMSSDDETSQGSGADNDEQPAANRGVSFNEQVRVLPIPPITAYTPEQRYRMYANRFELRENKVRGKKEYEFDGFDWRNATEEHSMAICPLSGELLHPAHL